MGVILVVDDEVEVVDFLCNFLRRFNLSVIKATEGKGALETFKKNNPAWVLLDIKIPDISGLELLKEFKKINPDVKVIMITGRDDKESQVEAKKLGALDYLIKPLDLEELHNKIKTYILGNSACLL